MSNQSEVPLSDSYLSRIPHGIVRRRRTLGRRTQLYFVDVTIEKKKRNYTRTNGFLKILQKHKQDQSSKFSIIPSRIKLVRAGVSTNMGDQSGIPCLLNSALMDIILVSLVFLVSMDMLLQMISLLRKGENLQLDPRAMIKITIQKTIH